ncbi:hypothetical protein [Streptomyces sp. NPDC056144]|uniref:hypothetical protein n=1 Tax=unclassified Streptomyces TaxID=2593676 RepID=UPI0035DA31BC
MTEMSRIYADTCLKESGGGGLGDAVTRAVFPPAFEKAWRSYLLPRPWFVDAAETEAFARDLGTLFELLVSLPERLHGGDMERYAEAVGIDPRLGALLGRGASGKPALLGRADAYHDGTAYKLLEFNLGSEVGGLELAVFNQSLLGVPEFAAFAREHGLGHVDIGARMAAVLRERARPAVAGGGEPVIGLIEGRGGVAAYGRMMEATREAMARHGLDLRVGEVGDVRTRPDGKLTLRGTPLDLVLRNFAASQLLDDPDGPEVVEPFLRADAAGKTVLFTSLESGFFGNKNALSLLTDPRAALDADELALTERLLPLTRRLDAAGDPAVVDRCLAERERYILKPGAGYGGLDTYVGWETSEDAWRRLVTRALASGDYVVQERVVPRPEPVYDPATGAVDDWIAVLGIFVTEQGYAGTHARANRADGGAIVGLSSNPGTRMVGVFSHS